MITRALVDGELVHSTGGDLVVRQFNGLVGPAGVKAVRFDEPRAHGAVDYTEFYGGKTVEVLGLVKAKTPELASAAYDDVRALWTLNGSEDRVLTFRRAGMDEDERVRFRVNSGPSADLPWLPFVLYSVSLYVPDPRLYTDALRQAFYLPSGSTGDGFAFPLGFPLDFGNDEGVNYVAFNVGGTTGAPPTYTIQGPVTDGVITDLVTSKAIHLDGAVLSGSTLVVDATGRTVELDGTERFDFIDPSNTEWSDLAPGQHRVQLSGSSMVAGTTQLAVAWRDARI